MAARTESELMERCQWLAMALAQIATMPASSPDALTMAQVAKLALRGAIYGKHAEPDNG